MSKQTHKKVNNVLLTLLVVSFIIMISGCARKEAEIVIQKEKELVYILPPKEFTEPIIIPKPISQEQYLKMNYKEKEKELGQYGVRLINTLKNENKKKALLAEYIKEREGKENAEAK